MFGMGKAKPVEPARQFATDLEKLIASARRAGAGTGFIAAKLEAKPSFSDRSLPSPIRRNATT
jgi:hypothetical protein